MYLKHIKVITIVVSLLVLGISLTQNVLVFSFNNEIKTAASFDYFFMGAIALMGGGTLEQIIWLANPLSLIAIRHLVKNDGKAVWYSLIALSLAISFFFWNEILGSESGSMAKIISLEPGYYLWVLSILLLTIGIFINFRTSLKTILQS